MKQKKIPVVSVILRFFNDQDYLQDCIKSILDQDYENIELILINNGSTDKSQEIVEKFLPNPKIKILHNKENIISGAYSFKKGFKEASGKYITLFCADDVMNKNCITQKIDFLENNPEFLACFADLEIIDANSNKTGEKLESIQYQNRYQYLNHIFHKYFCVTFPGATIKKEQFLYEAMDERLIHFFDIKLWVNILLRGEIKVLKQSHVQYRQHDNNVSSLSNNRDKHLQYLFEIPFFYDEFFKIDNYDLILKTFPNEKNILDNIDRKKDRDLLQIAIAIILFNSEDYNTFIFGNKKNIALQKITRLLEDETTFAKATKKLIDRNFICQYSKYYNEGLEFDCNLYKKRNFFDKIFNKKLRKKRRLLRNNHKIFKIK